jgi:hypothetical protein
MIEQLRGTALAISGIVKRTHEPDAHKGAVEGDRPEDLQHGNPNAPAIGSDGLPDDPIAVAEDRIGAHVDQSEIAQADETGQSSGAARDEEAPLD